MNEIKREDYRKSLITSPPKTVAQAVQTSSDNVKAEFGPNCKAKYSEIVSNLKFMSQFHDLQAVFDALKQDFGLQ